MTIHGRHACKTGQSVYYRSLRVSGRHLGHEVHAAMLREKAGVRVPTVLRRRILYDKPRMLRVQLDRMICNPQTCITLRML
jgi:hypothetical protein